MDVFEVADLLVELTRREYGDAVAVIAYYGSHATGNATARSDLDIYYIPDDGKAGGLYRSLVFEGRAFEFWPVSWGFAERIASGKHFWAVAPAIIANAGVLYVRSEADRARFAALQQQIAELQKPEQRSAMLKLALEAFKLAPYHRDRLALSCAEDDVMGARWAGVELINTLLDSLALVNQTFFPRTWSADLNQLTLLTCQPTGLRESIETILTADDLSAVSETAAALVSGTRSLLVAQQQTINDPFSFNEMFTGYYPGVNEYVTKIVSACARGNRVNAVAAAAQLQAETALMLARTDTGIPFAGFNVCGEYREAFDRLGFPDLAAAAGTGDLERIAELAREFDARSRDYFSEKGVPLNVAETIEELRRLIG